MAWTRTTSAVVRSFSEGGMRTATGTSLSLRTWRMRLATAKGSTSKSVSRRMAFGVWSRNQKRASLAEAK